MNQNHAMAEQFDKDSNSPTEPELCRLCHIMHALPFSNKTCSSCCQQVKREPETCQVKLEEVSNQSQNEHTEDQENVCKRQEGIEFSQQEQTPAENYQDLPTVADITKKRQKFLKLIFTPTDEIIVKIEEGAYPPKSTPDTSLNNDEFLPQQPEMLPIKRKCPQVTRNKCNYCHKKTGLLGYLCKYCSINYCHFHRIPQSHFCLGDYMTQGRKKLRTQLLSASSNKKHKGKVLQI